MKTTRVPDNACPCCNMILDTHTNVLDATPKSGDLSICYYCGGISMLDIDLRSVAITTSELDEILKDNPLLKEEILSIRRLFGLSPIDPKSN